MEEDILEGTVNFAGLDFPLEQLFVCVVICGVTTAYMGVDSFKAALTPDTLDISKIHVVAG